VIRKRSPSSRSLLMRVLHLDYKLTVFTRNLAKADKHFHTCKARSQELEFCSSTTSTSTSPPPHDTVFTTRYKCSRSPNRWRFWSPRHRPDLACVLHCRHCCSSSNIPYFDSFVSGTIIHMYFVRKDDEEITRDDAPRQPQPSIWRYIYAQDPRRMTTESCYCTSSTT